MFDWCKWRLPVIIKEDEIQNKKELYTGKGNQLTDQPS